MDWLPLALLVILFLLVMGLVWHALRQKRRLQAYTRAVRQAAAGGGSAQDLPADAAGFEQLSNTVRAYGASLQERLAAANQERLRLASMIEQMTDGVLIVDAGGEVVFINPAAERILEGARTGRRVAEVLRHHQLVEAWQRCRETGQVQSEAVELPTRRQFLPIFAQPDRYSDGTLLLIQDLTRVRRLETVRRDFISNVSHELRTPLASLKALTETLRDGALEDPQAATRFLNRIETEVDALTQMAQELLELTRIESGQVALELSATAPGRLLNATAERMHLQAERAGLTLEVNMPAGLPEVKADEARLEQVLVNLIHNALKFTLPGGLISLSAAQEGQQIHFSIRDTGVGIPADDLERIFERFYKADRARSGGGTGLGLSIARHIVEGHGGRIWAESREGQGSTFHFTIPIA